MNDSKSPLTLLPPALARPVYVLWLLVLPQVALLALNLRAWQLVHAELNAKQLTHARIMGVYELALLLFGVGLWCVLRWWRRAVDWRPALPMLALHVGYLWMILQWGPGIIPTAVASWMLPETEFVYYQFALIMPAVFYAGIHLATFPLPMRRGADVGVTLAALVGLPAGWYLFMLVLRGVFFRGMPEVVIVTAFVGSTILAVLAFIRALMHLHGWLAKARWTLLVPFVAGLGAPLGGLLLNSRIPFPYDFQSVDVYVFTIVNGLVLLLPRPRAAGLAAVVWTLRCALLPFSAYFFVVFLPFLPLSLLAMIAVGAGFLILAPTLLFVIHVRRVCDEGRILKDTLGRLPVALLLVVALALLPAGFTARAYSDRAALNAAMALTYSPDLNQAQPRVNAPAAGRALRHLRRMKDGIFLPFLSDGYDRIVFNGMVLPDNKMDQIHKVLFGRPPQWAPVKSSPFGDLFGRSRGRDWMGTRRRTPPPAGDVRLEDVQVDETVDGPVARAAVTFRLKNQDERRAEFTTAIELPPGVLVSGYWLKIGAERAPGRIFEKKTALWVYHMIRDTERRDPGLLVYTSDHALRLSVFPFEAHEERLTGLEFTYPAALRPRLLVGGRDVELARDRPATGGVARVAAGANASWLALSPAALAALPAAPRTPYLHFILDASVDAASAWDEFAGRMMALMAHTPAVPRCRITMANYAAAELTDRPIGADGVRAVVQGPARRPIAWQGAFCPERAIKMALLERDRAAAEDPAAWRSVPIFVVLTATNSEVFSDAGTGTFGEFVPEASGYYRLDQGGALTALDFDDRTARPAGAIEAPPSVVALRSGPGVALCRADAPGAMLTLHGADGPAQVFDPAAAAFRALDEPVRIDAGTTYARGAALWEAYRDGVRAPPTMDGRRAQLVTEGRACGVLTPATSYMVVENNAQWTMLQRKEKQALGARGALEFEEPMESPAPSALWLLPVVLLLLRKRETRSIPDA